MILVGDDECSVYAGLVGVFCEAARSLYGMEQPVLARGKGLKTWIVHFSGDVYQSRKDPGVGNTISTEPVSRQAIERGLKG